MIAMVADAHIGNHQVHATDLVCGMNSRCRENLDSLKGALDAARVQDASLFVIAGDLLDTMRPTPQALAAVGEMLQEFGRPIIILPGNHDRNSSLPGDHALGVFSCIPNVQVLDEPTVLPLVNGPSLVCLPFDREPVETWLDETLDRLLGSSMYVPRPLFLVMHQGIKDDTMPQWMKDASDAIHVNRLGAICAEHSIQRVLAGHWHAHKSWEWVARGASVAIEQIGALNPVGFSDPGLDYGHVVFADIGGGVNHCCIRGPRFVTLRDPADSLPGAPGDKLHVRYIVSPEKLGEATEQTKAILEAGGGIVGAHAEADDARVEEATRAAATEAASAETLEQALAAYVAEMPLVAGVDRGRVLAECRRLLGI